MAGWAISGAEARTGPNFDRAPADGRSAYIRGAVPAMSKLAGVQWSSTLKHFGLNLVLACICSGPIELQLDTGHALCTAKDAGDLPSPLHQGTLARRRPAEWPTRRRLLVRIPIDALPLPGVFPASGHLALTRGA